LPTPVDRAARLSEQLGVEIWVKRDDLTGSTLTGNKVRKLEYLFAEAIVEKADVVVTCGGEQSNHCRATAMAARQLGLDSYLLLRTEDPSKPPASEANILLDRLAGAEIRWVSRPEYARRAEIFPTVAAELRERGRRPYLVPEGGSNALGAWGYVACVEELAAQLPPGPWTLVYAAGSGGTGAGLIAGVAKLGLPWRVAGVNVCDDRAYFVRVIGDILDEAAARFELPKISRETIEICDGYVGLGFAKSRPEELAELVRVSRAEGLVLDPVYTGKAWFGLVSQLGKNRATFGERICFLHTGGIFGLFPKAAEIATQL
jgi:D-cysteine desulfhydrase